MPNTVSRPRPELAPEFSEDRSPSRSLVQSIPSRSVILHSWELEQATEDAIRNDSTCFARFVEVIGLQNGQRFVRVGCFELGASFGGDKEGEAGEGRLASARRGHRELKSEDRECEEVFFHWYCSREHTEVEVRVGTKIAMSGNDEQERAGG